MLALSSLALALAAALPVSPPMPRYQHVFVIVDENKDASVIFGNRHAPRINALARAFGSATHYDAVAHPSEPNYVALVGGSTFGVRNDGPFTTNVVDAPSLATQFDAAHLSWKGYYEGIPSPGSLDVYKGLYAAKHSGFLNYAGVQRAPAAYRAQHLVGFDQLTRDAAEDRLPNFALIVPNLCDDMHGVFGLGVPHDCFSLDRSGLIARGDKAFGAIVDEIVGSPVWKSKDNVAIVLTFDEDDGDGKEGGGGRVPLLVMTNHGKRGVVDATPYTHYSLLRTIEDAFGLPHLAHAAQANDMTPLFALER
jgi:phospholipase C